MHPMDPTAGQDGPDADVAAEALAATLVPFRICPVVDDQVED